MASGIRKGLLTAFLVLLAACSGQPEDPAAAVARATQVLRDGRSAEAGALARAGAERWSASRYAVWYWRFRHLEAESHLYAQRPKEAAALLQEQLPVTPEYDVLRVQRDYLDAYAKIRGNQTSEGLAALASIAARAESLGLLDVWLDVVALHAQSLLILGQFDVGDRMLFDALARSADAVAHQRGKILLNLGMSRLVRNRFDEALTYFERLLADRSIETTYVYRAALSNAGICHARLGDFDKAIALQRRAVDGHERAGLDQYLQQSLGELGTTFMFAGRTSDSVGPLQRALDIASGKYQADAVVWANNLAKAYGDISDWDRSEQFNEVAVRLKNEARASSIAYNIFNRARIAAGRGNAAAAVAGFEEAIGNATNDPYAGSMAHAELARVYRATSRAPDAMRHFDVALDLIERTRVDLLTREYRLTFLARFIQFHQNYVDALVANGDIERALEVAESSRARVLAERHGVARAARVPAQRFVQMARRTGSVLLSYWLAPGRSFVWIITGSGIRCITLPGSLEIAPLVRGYRDLVTVSLADPLAVESSPGTRLSDAVLKPVLDAIPHGAAVVIVPDGALHDLSFDMLPVPAPTPHYWIEDVTVTLAPSLALAVTDGPARAHAGRSLLLVGDPVNSDTSLPPLTFAGTELTAIERAFAGSAQVLRGAQATPQAVSDSQPARFGFIHFAAHATASAESPLDSAILLSPESSPAQIYKLYARDVAALPLTADVVTLSACRSAGGRAYGGEGLVGFAWAFLRAGARQVVAGLWDVDDQSTALLMERYYQRLGAGATAAAALRDAKLSLLHSTGNFRKPYYWAAFAVFASSLDPS